jgi:hypothetical protein
MVDFYTDLSPFEPALTAVILDSGSSIMWLRQTVALLIWFYNRLHQILQNPLKYLANILNIKTKVIAIRLRMAVAKKYWYPTNPLIAITKKKMTPAEYPMSLHIKSIRLFYYL